MSVIVMKAMRNFRNIFSLLGVSIAGALVSNLSQAILSQYLFNLPDIKFLILPVLIISLITGSIIGIFTIIFNRE